MSSSRRNKQWAGHDWPASDAQHPQYGSQGIDQLAHGMAGVSLQNSHYAHGSGIPEAPYAQDGQYYQPDPYSYPQPEGYPSQENAYPSQEEPYSTRGEVYAQPNAYAGETSGAAQYSQDNQYRGESYDYQNTGGTDQNNHQYTVGSSSSSRQQHQHYSTQAAKGKSRLGDPASYNKPKGSKDKGRERDRRYEKDKPSSSRQNRPKAGKAQAEDDYQQDDLSPFYKTTSSTQEYPEQEAANPDDPQSFESTTLAASDTTSGHDDNYTTVPPISTEQPQAYDDAPVQEDPSTYGYADPYSEINYPGARNVGSGSGSVSGSGSRRHQRDRPAVPDPYQPDISDNIESLLAEPNGYIVAGSSSLEEDGSMGLSGNYTYPYEDGGGQQTPRAGTPRATITSSVGQAELDDRFIVEHSTRFYAGEVFKVLWSEPLGSGRADMTDAETRSQFGQRFYVGIRRFIIVGTDEGHSTCVPILTYERRACTKRGVKPRTHGVIYLAGTRPRTLDGEPKLGCPPVKIELDYPSERIVRESRVNYSKLVTVEHNIKVFFIGRIAPEDLAVVHESVDRCWESKTKAAKDHSNRRHQDHRSHRY